ncbi:MAG: gliding motility-associated C-terminal domain-containing protein, partial [Saprospiraceae bacterium]|nr:gliding motility-associated C-terminal domain-containing protein [Saprospiraceae bacterium]
TLTFTPNAGQCANANTMSITVNAATSPALTPIGPFCVSAAPTALNTTQSGITGNWAGPGVAGNSFNPATAGAGNHTLTFTPNAGQCANANTMSVTVNPNPTANVPVPFEVCVLIVPPTLLSENSAVVLNQITGGNAGLTVNWFFDAAATMPIPNINNIFLAIPTPTTVYATVSNGSCSSSTVPVGILISQPPVINPPGAVSACQSYTLPPITGTNLMGSEAYYTGPNGTGTQFLPGQVITSTITLFAYAGSGICADQEQFTITITPLPTANPPGAPLSTCDNGAGIGQFNLTNLNGIISGGSGTVNWFSNAAGTISIPNPGAYNSASGTVYATVSNGTCTSPAVPLGLQVNPLPVVNLTVTQAISCSASANGAISTSIGTATGPFTFDWNINALDGQQNPANLGPGTYSVVVTTTNTGCVGMGSITLSAPTLITLNCAQQNPVSSIGGTDGSATVQVSGGTAAYSVAWSGAASGSQNQPTAGTATITGLIAGTYNLLVTDANGCTQTCSFTITAPNCNLAATAVGTNPGCNGAASGSIALTVTGGTGGTGALTFDWNDNTLDGSEDPTGLSAGTYSVTVTDGAGCTANAMVTLTDPAALSFAATGNVANCLDPLNGSISITLASGGTSPYEVSYNGLFFTGIGSLPAQIAGIAPGNYTVTLQDANDCMVETQVVVFAAPTYTLDLGPDLYVRIGDSVRLEGLANFSIDSVVWTPTEFLTDVTGPVTFTRPLASTAYQLIAFDENGCRAEDAVWVFVEQRYEVFIPNTFSPNGDGINDKFRVFGNDKVKMIRSLQIFDRWGGNVFGVTNVAPDDSEAGWNGSHRGQIASAGVYLYLTEIEFFDDHVETVVGEVTLVR